MTPPNGALSRLSLSDLERMIRGRQRQLNKLQKRRAKIQRKLDALDEKIAAITGGRRAAGGGGRARIGTNLPDTINKLLARASRPMSVGEIAERALAAGYHTGSANFRGIVNQALVKDKRFVNDGRGVYRLKGSGK